ncbi:hypothetical protein BDR22DRAFT_823891 [Usnea florida]
MTARTIRTRDRGLGIFTGPPRPSSPLLRGRENALGLPPPSFDDLRTVNGWPPLLLPPKPLYFLQQHPNVDRQLPYGRQPAFEVRPPNGRLDMLEPTRTPRFDPRSMLWWSQWEIVFAKRALGLSDNDTCSVFKYRWREMDRSTKYMQPYHVAQILEILSDGHPWHAHAFRPADPRPEMEICNEFLQDLRMAKEAERLKMESDYAERMAREL